MSTILKNSESLYPFFGNKMSFIRGLDPLGLQNNSEATFAMLSASIMLQEDCVTILFTVGY